MLWSRAFVALHNCYSSPVPGHVKGFWCNATKPHNFGSGASLPAIPKPNERGKTLDSVVLSRNMGKQLR
jgi:hypothetical protein